MNVDQKMIFNYITNEEKDSKRMFYIGVPECTEKTFPYKALIYYFSGIGK